MGRTGTVPLLPGEIFVLDWNLIGIGAAFIIYFAAMIYIGFIYFKKTKTTSDHALGGRKLHPFLAEMSAEASPRHERMVAARLARILPTQPECPQQAGPP